MYESQMLDKACLDAKKVHYGQAGERYSSPGDGWGIGTDVYVVSVTWYAG